MKTFILSILLLFAVATSPGCAGGKGQLNPATGIYDKTKDGDVFIVNAQRVRGVALETFDAFMKLERSQETRLLAINPEIHKAAEEIRKNGKIWLTDLSTAIAAYQTTRTEDGKKKLEQVLSVVASAVASAQKYTIQAR